MKPTLTSTTRTIALGLIALLALGELIVAGFLLADDSDRAGVASARPTVTLAPAVTDLAVCNARDAPAPAAVARPIYVAQDIDLAGTAGWHGLSYLPDTRTLAYGAESGDQITLEEVTLFGDPAGNSSLPITRSDGLATDGTADSPVVVLDTVAGGLELLSKSGSRTVNFVRTSVDLHGIGAADVTGIDVDTATGSLVLVDPIHDRIVRLPFRQLPRGAPAVAALTDGCYIDLPVLGEAEFVSLAIRPTDGHMFLAGEDGSVLVELDRHGQPVLSFALGDLGLHSVRGMTFGPSPNPTDSEESLRLYMLDADAASARIIALSFAAPIAPSEAATNAAGTIASRIDTTTRDPISSDPGGVAYDPVGRRILVTDSDIDELGQFEGEAVFALGEDGSWTGLGSPGGSNELTDVTVDAAGGRWFFSDDSARVVTQVDLGEDGQYDTLDDRISKISTADFGSLDPEGIAFGQNSLFVADGQSSQIYRLSAGEDGIFSGIGTTSDDTVTSFDTSALGIADPEGVDFDPARGTLYLRGRDEDEPIAEVATDGTLVSRITLPAGMLISPGGIALVPALDGSTGLSLLIADRGEDNASSARPVDGGLVEVRVDWLANRTLTAP